MHQHSDSDTFSSRVLHAIEEEGIHPKPRWHFLLHEWVVWTVALASLFVGSTATALTLYIANASFFMERQIERSALDTVFELVPVMWLAVLAAGVFYAVHATRSTRSGYRWHASWVVTIAAAVSIVLGSTIYALGGSESIDRYLLSNVPMYRPLSGFKPMHWMRPHEGVMAGFVESYTNGVVVLQTLEGDVRTMQLAPSIVPPMVTLSDGTAVRIVATTTDAGEWMVLEIRPFRGRGGMMHELREPILFEARE